MYKRLLCAALAAVVLALALAPCPLAFDPDALYGDANGDGKINARDVTAVMRAISSKDTSKINVTNADVNVDDKVNARDVTKIMRRLVGDETARLGHNDRMEIVTPSTCTENGTAVLVCTECGDQARATLPLAAHDYVETVILEGNCGWSGLVQYECSVCHKCFTEEIPPTGEHVYEMQYDEFYKAPTGAHDGRAYFLCVVCRMDGYFGPVPRTGGEKELRAEEEEVVRLVNIERKKNGLAPLAIDNDLFRLARMKSEDMSDNDYFDHYSEKYGRACDMMDKAGVQWWYWGENIAVGQRSAAAVVERWMDSPGHRANILDPNFTRIGVGLDPDGDYWTQMFAG